MSRAGPGGEVGVVVAWQEEIIIREAGPSRAREEISITELEYPCREPQLSRS